MKTLICTLAALAALGYSVPGEDTQPHITGEVFIVTAGGDNKLLGRVEVAAYKPDEVEAAFKAVDVEITANQATVAKIAVDAAAADGKAENKVLDDIYNSRDFKSDQDIETTTIKDKLRTEWAYEYAKGSCKYYARLPAPIASVKTDSQGKYDLPLPSGDPVILAAHATRLAGDGTEYYYWIVKCDPSKSATVTLSNDNLTSSDSKDSVVKTDADEGEGEQGMPIFEAVLTKGKEQAREAEEQAKEQAKEAADQAEKALMDQYCADPSMAQKAAVLLYPELATAGTPLNKEFTARYKLYQTSKPDFFTEPDWPIRLAKECAESVKGK